jgi:predicted secreted hydrolase
MRGIRAAAIAGALGALGVALVPGRAASASPPLLYGVLPEATAAAGFAQADAPRQFAFPRDHGPHPRFRQEWWYVTGNLDEATGERFGFELTFFRFALKPGESPTETQAASAWRTSQIYLAHFAISDVARRKFHVAQKLSRAAVGLAGAEALPLRVWIDDWTLAGPAAGGESWTLHAAQPGYELTLTLTPLTAPVLNGDAGLSEKSDEPGSASYYYSLPRLAVHGRLTRDGQPRAVSGLAWFDREWGSGALGAREAGWDWFALQINDGAALMFYALRNCDGARDAHSAGTWIEPSGVAHALRDQDVLIDVSDHWTSTGGVRYPSAWRIRVPSLALDVSVHPVLADQELKVKPQYWEGAVDVSGMRSGAALGGRGYVELVGYDRGTRGNGCHSAAH